MKRLLFFVLMSNMVVFGLLARRQINLSQSGQVPHHLEIPFIPADQQEVYYDDDTDEIIIDGTGDASYYDVDIFCCDDGLLVLQDTVNGSYDTIDVSSLPDGDYQIVITSSYDNEYEGFFIKD